MTPILILRHAATTWNAERRIQGTIDTPLSDIGVAQARSWRLPEPESGWTAVASPRLRARQTAQLIGLTPKIDPRLAEMNWGAWEGQRFDDLVQTGDLSPETENLGLDFRPPGGESPRDVQARLRSWLSDVVAGCEPVVAVSHHGVLRALYALAVGWDMVGPPPTKLRNGHAHRFAVAVSGDVSIIELNLPLGPV